MAGPHGLTEKNKVWTESFVGAVFVLSSVIAWGHFSRSGATFSGRILFCPLEEIKQVFVVAAKTFA